MDKKRSLHQTEVQKHQALAVISIIVLIAVVAVLFYFSPKQLVGKVYEAPPLCADRPAGVLAWWAGEPVNTADNRIEDLTSQHLGTMLNENDPLNYPPGKVGKALHFDGVDKYVSIPDHNDFDFGSRPFTIEGWIKTESTKQQVLVSHGTFFLGLNIVNDGCGGPSNICVYSSAGAEGLRSGVPLLIPTNEWIHIVAVRDGTTVTFYVNGESRGTAAVQESISNVDILLLISSGNPTYAFEGLIDELTIYNRALSPEEITAIYTANSAGKCKEESYQSPGMCADGIDNDNDGLIDCADSGCSDTGNTYYISSSALRSTYEVPLLCPQSRISTNVRGDILSNLDVCDSGTEDLGNRVTLCQNAAFYATLDATSILRGRNQDPFTDQGVTFLFDEVADVRQQKKVTLHSTNDLSDGAVAELDLQNFTTNMLKGQRPIFIVDGEYYLLSYEGSGFFVESHLKLTHLPEGFRYDAEQYPGTNTYVFRILGGRIIQMHVNDDAGKFDVQALPPGQAPVSFAVPNSLSRKLEVTFDRSNPVRITDPADLGTLTVCEDDRAALIQTQAFVCKNNEPFITLVRNNLTEVGTPGNSFAFLYTYDAATNTKKVSVFILKSLTPANTPLDQLDFASAMVAGRRIAFKFQDKLYLLTHPTAPPLRLPALSAVYYDETGHSTTFPAAGSDLSVALGIHDGSRVFLETDTGFPPPPIEISAKTLVELGPINLDEKFSTFVSSISPVQLQSPTVRVVPAESVLFRRDVDVFSIRIGDLNTLLRFQVPYALTDRELNREFSILLYYGSVSSPAEGLIKVASIYKLYNLSAGGGSHSYDNNFIDTFTSGKEIAFAFGNSFYLLGYQGSGGALEPFSISRVKLLSLDRETEFSQTVEISGERISFRVPEGEVVISIDRDHGEINFDMHRGIELLEVTTFIPEDYSIMLTTSNRVGIGSTTLELCNQGIYGPRTAADVCYHDPRVHDIVVDGSVLLKVGTDTYLLETNGRTGDAKQVTIRRILQFRSVLFDGASRAVLPIPDWNIFTQHIRDRDIPVINITSPLWVDKSTRLYLPAARDNLLGSFSLQPYPRGTTVAVQNVQALSPITSNGSLVFGDKVIFVEQSVSGPADNRIVSAMFTHQPHSYVPDNGDALFLNSSESRQLDFVVAPGSPVFTLVVNSVEAEQDLVQLELTGLFNRLFAEGDVRVLHLGGATIRLEVTAIETRDRVRHSVIKITKVP